MGVGKGRENGACVDYTNLNRACLKDCFPIPKIDQTMDATARYAFLSFLIVYSSYNQIPIAVDDQEKTTFITEHRLYCYMVMPFRLKNVGSTYQRLMNMMFKSQIGNKWRSTSTIWSSRAAKDTNTSIICITPSTYCEDVACDLTQKNVHLVYHMGSS